MNEDTVIDSLFEHRTEHEAAASERGESNFEYEIRRIHEGLKPCAWYELSADDHGLISELMSIARRFSVSVSVSFDGERCHVFALRRGAEWRPLALMELWDAALGKYQWSDSLETLQSRLLGYSADEVQRWLSETRYRIAGWGGITVFVLVSGEQLEALGDVAMRALPPAAFEHGARLFHSLEIGVNGTLQVRADADVLARPRHLVRCGIRLDVWRTFFDSTVQQDDSRRPFNSRLVSAEEIRALINPGLTSRLELFHAGTWRGELEMRTSPART